VIYAAIDAKVLLSLKKQFELSKYKKGKMNNYKNNEKFRKFKNLFKII